MWGKEQQKLLEECQFKSSRELGKALCLICFLCWRKLNTALIPFPWVFILITYTLEDYIHSAF